MMRLLAKLSILKTVLITAMAIATLAGLYFEIELRGIAVSLPPIPYILPKGYSALISSFKMLPLAFIPCFLPIVLGPWIGLIGGGIGGIIYTQLKFAANPLTPIFDFIGFGFLGFTMGFLMKNYRSRKIRYIPKCVFSVIFSIIPSTLIASIGIDASGIAPFNLVFHQLIYGMLPFAAILTPVTSFYLAPWLTKKILRK